MGRTGRKVPDRWFKYTKIGKPLPGTRFICFKTPLKQDLTLREKENSFTLNHLCLEIAKTGSRLGLVIDLTNTNRYYDKNDLIEMSINYEKIYCPGHEIDEDESLVQQFFDIVDRYETTFQGEKDILFGVHCTHGVNRTGYMICRYLIERSGFSAEDALDAFRDSRGHGVERENYLNALIHAAKRAGRLSSVNEPQSSSAGPEGSTSSFNRDRERDDEYHTASGQTSEIFETPPSSPSRSAILDDFLKMQLDGLSQSLADFILVSPSAREVSNSETRKEPERVPEVQAPLPPISSGVPVGEGLVQAQEVVEVPKIEENVKPSTEKEIKTQVWTGPKHLDVSYCSELVPLAPRAFK